MVTIFMFSHVLWSSSWFPRLELLERTFTTILHAGRPGSLVTEAVRHSVSSHYIQVPVRSERSTLPVVKKHTKTRAANPHVTNKCDKIRSETWLKVSKSVTRSVVMYSAVQCVLL